MSFGKSKAKVYDEESFRLIIHHLSDAGAAAARTG
jgi:hypothetical protein